MSDRTAQMLTTRLSELSSVALRSGAAPTAIASLLESASVATMHALALELQCGAPVQEAPALAPARPTLVRLLDAA